MPKVIDCFTFFNELDLLEIRLAYLYDVVDRFVIVEADCTFSGTPKTHLLHHHLDRFAKYADKMVVCSIQMPTFKNHKGVAWERERYQRDYLATAIKKLKLDASDYVLISDIDEIPNREILKSIQEGNATSLMEPFKKNNLRSSLLKHSWKLFKSILIQRETTSWILRRRSSYLSHFKTCLFLLLNKNKANFLSLRLEIFDYYLNYLETDASDFTEYNRIYFKCVQPYWLDKLSPSEIRQSILLFKPHTLPTIKNGGWHFSFLGGVEAILYKLKSYSHQELNTPHFSSEEYINSCIREGYHPLRRFLDSNCHPSFQKMDMDSFPVELKNILLKYPHLILP